MGLDNLGVGDTNDEGGLANGLILGYCVVFTSLAGVEKSPNTSKSSVLVCFCVAFWTPKLKLLIFKLTTGAEIVFHISLTQLSWPFVYLSLDPNGFLNISSTVFAILVKTLGFCTYTC